MKYYVVAKLHLFNLYYTDGNYKYKVVIWVGKGRFNDTREILHKEKAQVTSKLAKPLANYVCEFWRVFGE